MGADANNFSNIIEYLRACYEADNGARGVRDFLSSSVEHRWITEHTEELLTGHTPIIPIPDKQGRGALRTLQVYGKEKELVYASI